MIRAETLEQGMESRTMVRMPEVAELMEENVIPEVFRKPHDIEIQVDIPFSGTAAPI